MKRIFLAFAALTCVAVCLSSCSKEDFEEQLYEGSEAVRSHGGDGTVEKSQLFDNVKRVGAINAFMKICGPDINGGSSS